MILLCLLAFSSGPSGGCGEDACEEPDPRGDGGVGDSCVTTRECAAGLACLGTDVLAGAFCTSPSELPGGEDPGCLEHASDWPYHESSRGDPPGTDEDGCEQLVFVNSCNCRGSAGEGCRPVEPFYRREVWRRCGCCWRLVVLWVEDAVCAETD